jgi:hypothetical protein
MSASPKDFTNAKLQKMGIASGAIDSDRGTMFDDQGMQAAGSSQIGKFNTNGGLKGAGRKANLGRPGRANGGAVSGALHRTLRTEKETLSDENKDVPTGRVAANVHDSRPGAKLSSKYAQPIRVHKDDPRTHDKRARADQKHAARAGEKQAERSGAFATGGRVGLARGGRAKGKTTVNVIVAPQGGQQPPPPMAAPPPMPPPMPPPQRPPMPPPGAGGAPNVNIMPGGGAPMGPAGAPPPGVPPGLRKRGGRVVVPQAPSHQGRGKFPKSAPAKSGSADFGPEGKRNFGLGGTPGQAKIKQTHGSGSGLGRIDNARREA